LLLTIKLAFENMIHRKKRRKKNNNNKDLI
jgi:hypothetical protein